MRQWVRRGRRRKISQIFLQSFGSKILLQYFGQPYAGKWVIPAEDQRYDLKVVNQLGLEYAKAIDSPEKEAKLLRVLECFHGYLMKYLVMIIRGTIPPVNSHAGKDAKELLRTLTPRGVKLDNEQIDRACGMLHLAFKQATTEEIYDTLVFCLIKAARKYDPFYTDKVEEVCATIDVLPKQFTEQHLVDRIGYDCTGILRSLVRKHYLRSITGKKKVVGCRKTLRMSEFSIRIELSAVPPP